MCGKGVGPPIDGPILLEKANKFLQDLGKDTTVSRGWIDRWKKRHSIGGQRVVGESAAVNVGEVEKWKEEVLTPLLQTYTYDDIFNMDETGLFYKLMVDKTLHFKGEKCSGGKLSKERLTVALCANMSGTEKEVPIVIGKFGKPRCFKNVTNLPCQYYHNKKAWMVSDIFQAWVRDFDRRMTSKNKKVLLVIDNCPSHPTMNRLMSIRLLFTPPNTTSVLQPMDQGIIRNFKSYYRQQVLQFTVDYIDTHGKKPDASINVLQAIRWVHKAWHCVTKETIARCFHHGLGHTNLDQTDVTSTVDDNEEGDTVRNLNLLLHTIDPTSNVTANELLAVDADVTVAEHLSDAEIVQSVTSWGTLDDSDGEDEAEIVEPNPPTMADANNALDVLRRFIDTREVKDYNNCLKAISTLSYTVDFSQQNIFSQTTLDKFFK
ncbi:tigger transposable element-derived protein 6-like [Watersipora subatra]|uniref:tigger transposable element-derived protein 6-like n=1 Tax=Watersipora subatra TaxID=2589382 RepID=UPI00355C24AB